MKTKAKIQKRLEAAEKKLHETRARFEEDDNYDDMDLIPIFEEEINILKWVLKL